MRPGAAADRYRGNGAGFARALKVERPGLRSGATLLTSTATHLTLNASEPVR